MKTNTKILLTFIVLALSLSGCIKETFPQGGSATKEQIGESASALDAAMSGIPAQLSQGYLVYGEQVTEIDMAYPALMIIYSQQLGDIFPLGDSGYDWYRGFDTQQGLGENSSRAYVPWRTMYMFIKSANDIIAAVSSIESPSDVQKGYLGMAYAYRAWAYWHLWNMYIPVKNDYTTIGDEIMGLTVPIVTEKTLESDGKNNPRATEQVMYDFIMSDLQLAEDGLTNYTPNTKLYPNLAVIYGLKARAYLSKLDYANAAIYARKAIDVSGRSPLTQDQWEDPNAGFCDAASQNSWMWYIAYSAEAMGNLCNFTGWVSNEADWGYATLTFYGINRWLYDRMNDTDFRKHSFVDPKKYDYYNYKTCRNQEFIESLPDYSSIKFRCKGGVYNDYATGGATDVPLMRIEEMYLIEAEAIGVSNLADGKNLLQSFMQTYRDPSYTVPVNITNVDLFQEEVLFQKRIEFWGEGLAFFDAKRLRAGSYQSYEGTNAPGDVFKLNAKGIKPGWIFMIPRNEVNNNVALEGLNNPDPSEKIKPTL